MVCEHGIHSGRGSALASLPRHSQPPDPAVAPLPTHPSRGLSGPVGRENTRLPILANAGSPGREPCQGGAGNAAAGGGNSAAEPSSKHALIQPLRRRDTIDALADPAEFDWQRLSLSGSAGYREVPCCWVCAIYHLAIWPCIQSTIRSTYLAAAARALAPHSQGDVDLPWDTRCPSPPSRSLTPRGRIACLSPVRPCSLIPARPSEIVCPARE
jgi:hypothetical protein